MKALADVITSFPFCSCLGLFLYSYQIHLGYAVVYRDVRQQVKIQSDFLYLYPYNTLTLPQSKGSCIHTHAHIRTCTYIDTQTHPITAPTLKSSVVPDAQEWLQSSSSLNRSAQTDPANKCVKCKNENIPVLRCLAFSPLFAKLNWTSLALFCTHCRRDVMTALLLYNIFFFISDSKNTFFLLVCKTEDDDAL